MIGEASRTLANLLLNIVGDLSQRKVLQKFHFQGQLLVWQILLIMIKLCALFFVRYVLA